MFRGFQLLRYGRIGVVVIQHGEGHSATEAGCGIAEAAFRFFLEFKKFLFGLVEQFIFSGKESPEGNNRVSFKGINELEAIL